MADIFYFDVEDWKSISEGPKLRPILRGPSCIAGHLAVLTKKKMKRRRIKEAPLLV
jgi:hypothetical protein